MRAMRWLCVGWSVVATSCVVGAPPSFSAGTRWQLPLVDPLSTSRLVTPVMVGDKGPFLFAIDPDAHFTTADVALAGIAGVPAVPGERVSDEHDTTYPTWYAQLPKLRVGTLDLTLLTVGLVDNNRYSTDGRRIWGVLGRDVIADSLVFEVDRDRGVATLTVNDKYQPPPGAQILPYHKLAPRNGRENSPGLVATTRYLVTADVGGQRVDLHLDLGDEPSQLAPAKWAAAQLVGSETHLELVDEAGTHRDVTTVAPGRVTVPGTPGPVTRDGVAFVPYVDRRWLSGQIDGALGLGFFRPFIVAADWQHERFYVAPRASGPAVTAARLGRWSQATAGCAAAGCATASAALVTVGPPPEEGAPAPPSAVAHATLHVARDPALAGHNLELVLAATSATGAALPDVYVDLGAQTQALDAPIEPRYAGATFAVADLSPFPRACASHAPSCVHLAPDAPRQ